jgi:hypothetical protein
VWAGLAVVQRLYPAIDRVLRPIVADEERRAGARLVAPGREIRARDQQGLRALNDALRSAFDSPGPPPVAPGGAPTEAPPLETPERRFNGAGRAEHEPPPPPEPPALAMRFKQSPLRLHPGERRGTSLLFDPCQVPPGTPVSVEADPGLRIRLSGENGPRPRRTALDPPGRGPAGARLGRARLASQRAGGGRRRGGRARGCGRAPHGQRLCARDRPQGRGRATRGTVRPRERRGHHLRGQARVPIARTRRPPRRDRGTPRPRIPPLPNARGRGRRERGLPVGGRANREAPPGGAGPHDRLGRLRSRGPPRGPGAATPLPRAAYARLPRPRGI